MSIEEILQVTSFIFFDYNIELVVDIFKQSILSSTEFAVKSFSILNNIAVLAPREISSGLNQIDNEKLSTILKEVIPPKSVIVKVLSVETPVVQVVVVAV